ncbi:hypothetical protein CR513_21818, partial [Mucuna pruriens]
MPKSKQDDDQPLIRRSKKIKPFNAITNEGYSQVNKGRSKVQNSKKILIFLADLSLDLWILSNQGFDCVTAMNISIVRYCSSVRRFRRLWGVEKGKNNGKFKYQLGGAKEDGFGEGNYSGHSRSLQSSREERYETHERNIKDKRHERHGRRGEEDREELDMNMRRGIVEPCESYYDIKRLMRKRFIPPYERDLHNKLQRLYQGSKSVEEYHKEIDIDLLRAQVRESEEVTMTRFLHGLNREVKDVVELAMMVKDNGEVASESSYGETSTSSESENHSDDSHYEGELLMGSCVNVYSEKLVKKLALPTLVHPKPYRLQWVSEHGELVVNMQIEMAFTLESYEDKVLSDVVPIETTHLLLGRP